MVRPRWLKSRRFWTGVVLCLVAIAIIGPVIWIAIPKPGINRQNFRKIQVGMSLEDVTALMGRPPGNYAGPTSFILATAQGETIGEIGKTGPRQEAWMSDGGFVIIGLDGNDRVSGAGFSPVQDNSFIGRLLGH
jgi:hypothetical protein